MTFLLLQLTVIMFLFNARIGTFLLWFGVLKILFTGKGTQNSKLLKAICYSAPFYYFSIIGTSDRLSVCTLLTAIFCIKLFITHFSEKTTIPQKSLGTMVAFLFFIFGYAVSMMNSISPWQAFYDSYQIILLCLVIVLLAFSDAKRLLNCDLGGCLEIYIEGIVAVSIGIIVQFVLSSVIGIEVGHIFRYGRRTIYNLFFYAKSVLSLYLAVGLVFFFIRFLEKKKYISLVGMAVIMIAEVLNNSRTGLACSAVVIAIYFVFHIKETVSSMRVISIIITLVIAAEFIIQRMLDMRTGLNGIMDSNGRSDLIVEAVKLLRNYVFSGIGGCAEDYAATKLEIVIHNFAVAYLVQFGCIGGLGVNYIIISTIWKYRSDWSYYLIALILGGMMFANWQNAVYIIPVFVLAIIKAKISERGF